MEMGTGETESAQEGMNIDDDETPFVSERGFYQPSTDDTWEAYQALLCIVEQQLGGFSTAVLCGVAHEVLSVLKCQNIKTPYGKRVEIEKILKRLPDHTFEQLFEISRCITDFFRDDREDLWIGKEMKDGRDSLFVPEEGFYQPRTEDTAAAYKLLLDVIKSQIGEAQPDVILCTIAHEVLHTLKNEQFGELKTRKLFLENLLNRISDNNFNLLLYASDIIHDFFDPRLGSVNGISSSSRVEPTFAANTSRTVDFDQSTQNGWSDDGSPLEWETEAPSLKLEQTHHDLMVWDGRGDDHGEVRETDHDHITRRLSQLTTDDLGDGDDHESDGDDDENVDDDGDDDDDDGNEGEVDGGDDVDGDEVDGGDDGDDDFVVIEEVEDWVMVDSGTP